MKFNAPTKRNPVARNIRASNAKPKVFKAKKGKGSFVRNKKDHEDG